MQRVPAHRSSRSAFGRPPRLAWRQSGAAVAALSLIVGFVATGCRAGDDTVDTSPGTPYTSYIADVTKAVLSYEERCGLLDCRLGIPRQPGETLCSYEARCVQFGCKCDRPATVGCDDSSYDSSYQNRCGLLDPTREAERQQTILLSYPAYLTTARDVSAKAARVTYDSTCVVSALKDAPCSAAQVDLVRTGCATKEATGRVVAGRICGLHEECKAGYCKGLAAGSPCGHGTCAPLGNVGADCTEGAVACDPASTYCGGGSCLPRVAEGAQCSDTSGCVDGLFCVRAQLGDSQGKCQKPVFGQKGDLCDLDVKAGKPCASNLACYQDSMGRTLCQDRAQSRGACPTSEACPGTQTCARAVATAQSGICQPLGKPGDVCNINTSLGQRCQNTLVCFATDAMAQAVCVPQPDNGQPCNKDLACLIGLCNVNDANAKCTAKLGTGLACSDNGQCNSGMCSGNLCKSPVCQ